MAYQELNGQPSSVPDPRRNTMNGTGEGDTGGSRGAPGAQKKPNRLAALFDKLGLDAPTLIVMFK